MTFEIGADTLSRPRPTSLYKTAARLQAKEAIRPINNFEEQINQLN